MIETLENKVYIDIDVGVMLFLNTSRYMHLIKPEFHLLRDENFF